MEQDRAKQIQTMFSRITGRYDLMNRVMTGGLDGGWRKTTAAQLKLGENARVLDLATGTGDLAFAVRERFPSAHIVAADFSETILREGSRKAAQRSAATKITMCGRWAMRSVCRIPTRALMPAPTPSCCATPWT